MEHAAAHHLQFFGDAMFNEMLPDDYEPVVLSALRELDNEFLPASSNSISSCAGVFVAPFLATVEFR